MTTPEPEAPASEAKPSLLPQAASLFAVYAVSLVWMEFLSLQLAGTKFSVFQLIFIPAEAAFFTLLSAFFPRKNRGLTIFWLCLLTVFYLVQAVYHCQFGSFASLSIAGVGANAVTGFITSVLGTIKANAGKLLLYLLPAAAYILFSCLKKDPKTPAPFSLKTRVCLLALTLLCGLGAAALLPLGGTGNFTAYEAFHSSQVSTDSSAARIGLLPTSTLELSYLTGLRRASDPAAAELKVSADNPFAAEKAAEETPAADDKTVLGSAENDSGVESSASETDSAEPASAEASEPEAAVIDTSPNILSAIDFSALEEQSDEYRARLCRYFEEVEGSSKNEYTGLFEGYNLIYICGESFDTPAIDPVLTPTLYKLANNGIVLTNYYNSFKNVTTNGEYAMMTGMWPDLYRSEGSGDTNGTFYATATNYMPYGLGNIFADLGVQSFAYHGYYDGYYGRGETHPNLGYTCKFSNTGLSFTTTVPSSDYELIEQTVDDYIDLDRFNVYYMTFSGHGNYDTYNPIDERNLAYVSEVMADRNLSEGPLCYLAGNYELEKGLTYLMDRLEQAGKLENTVIVLAGDHYPYCLNTAQYRELMGADVDFDFESYRSTCIIWCGAIKEPIVCDTLCSNVDILPTVLNLFGIDYESRLLSGRDVFADEDHFVILQTKSYITDKVKFNADTLEAEWLIDTSGYTEAELKQYLTYMNDTVNSRFSTANSIVQLDFFRFVWEKSGLKNSDSN